MSEDEKDNGFALFHFRVVGKKQPWTGLDPEPTMLAISFNTYINPMALDPLHRRRNGGLKGSHNLPGSTDNTVPLLFRYWEKVHCRI